MDASGTEKATDGPCLYDSLGSRLRTATAGVGRIRCDLGDAFAGPLRRITSAGYLVLSRGSRTRGAGEDDRADVEDEEHEERDPEHRHGRQGEAEGLSPRPLAPVAVSRSEGAGHGPAEA